MKLDAFICCNARCADIELTRIASAAGKANFTMLRRTVVTVGQHRTIFLLATDDGYGLRGFSLNDVKTCAHVLKIGRLYDSLRAQIRKGEA